MSHAKRIDLGMTAYDELFMTDEERKENKLPKIYDIPLAEIDDFPNHPFKVRDDEDMENLIESIRVRGIITPAMVRKKPDGRYEMVSGHRRKRACKILGMETLRCEVVDLNKEEATVMMVESNFQRSEILPSEKAYAYKMRLEAMNKLPGRPSKNNLTPVVSDFEKLRTNEELAEKVGESREQIRRYIRLTNLIPELLDFIDEGKIKMRPAVELSYLDEETQRDVVDRIDETEAFPSHDQAIRIRKAYEAGEIDYEKVVDIMAESKPNQKPRFRFSFERLRPLIPKGYEDAQAEEYVVKALEHYKRYLQKQREQAR